MDSNVLGPLADITVIMQAMFLLTRPDKQKIEKFVNSQRDKPFSYPEVGASMGAAPAGYNVDHNRVKLGNGQETFREAITSLNNWKMFEMNWIELFPARAPIQVGVTVGVLIRHLGFWSLNASRIVYTIDESETVKRYGFAYGTLPGHAEQGEERFTVEYYRESKNVWYDLYAFSKPRHILAKAGYPISRLLQQRFAKASLKAMKDSVKA